MRDWPADHVERPERVAKIIAVLWLDRRDTQKVDDYPIPSNGGRRTWGGHRPRRLDSGRADGKMPLGDNRLVRMANEHTPAIRQADTRRPKESSPQKIGDVRSSHGTILSECLSQPASGNAETIIVWDRHRAGQQWTGCPSRTAKDSAFPLSPAMRAFSPMAIRRMSPAVRGGVQRCTPPASSPSREGPGDKRWHEHGRRAVEASRIMA